MRMLIIMVLLILSTALDASQHRIYSAIDKLHSDNWRVRAEVIRTIDSPELKVDTVRSSLRRILNKEIDLLTNLGHFPRTINGIEYGEDYGEYFYELISLVTSFNNPSDMGQFLEISQIHSSKTIGNYYYQIGDSGFNFLFRNLTDPLLDNTSILYYLRTVLELNERESRKLSNNNYERLKSLGLHLTELPEPVLRIYGVQFLGYFKQDQEVFSRILQLYRSDPTFVYLKHKQKKMYPVREQAEKVLLK